MTHPEFRDVKICVCRGHLYQCSMLTCAHWVSQSWPAHLCACVHPSVRANCHSCAGRHSQGGKDFSCLVFYANTQGNVWHGKSAQQVSIEGVNEYPSMEGMGHLVELTTSGWLGVWFSNHDIDKDAKQSTMLTPWFIELFKICGAVTKLVWSERNSMVAFFDLWSPKEFMLTCVLILLYDPKALVAWTLCLIQFLELVLLYT